MSRVVLPFAAMLITIATCFAAEKSLLARVTVYWRGESQPRASWNGMRLRPGHCAVDPKKIPYGSTVTIAGDELIAVDTGPSVVSRKAARRAGRTASERDAVVVDRYFETKAQAQDWEKSHPHFMVVRVAPPQQRFARRSAEMSKTGSPPVTRVIATAIKATSVANPAQFPRFMRSSQDHTQVWAASSQLMRWARRRA